MNLQGVSKPLRSVAYIRVSTEEQAEHGYSIDAQIDIIQQHCQLHNKKLVREYVDRGISGKSISGRTGLQSLLNDLPNGEFDEVIVWKISRISRSMKDLLDVVDKFEKHKVGFHSISENIETSTAMGRFSFQLLGAVAELERNTIVSNVKLGMKQRARTGRWNGGKVLGYTSATNTENSVDSVDDHDAKLVIVPEEAAIVKKIFHLYASGMGLKAIANKMNHEGYKTKRGNFFSTSAIKEIITNPLYNGKIRYNRYVNWNDRRRKGKNDEPIIVQGEHEAIIDDDLWNSVQSLQQKKAKTSPRKFNGSFLLTGLIKCPQCGSSMIASRTVNTLKNGEKITRKYYSCSKFRYQGSAACSANSVRAEESEAYVLNRLKKVVTHKTLLKNVLKRSNEKLGKRVRPTDDEKKIIDKTIKELEGKQKKYMALYENNLIDHDIITERMEELKEEIECLILRQEEINKDIGVNQQKPLSYTYVKHVLSQFDTLLEKVPLEKKKLLLQILIKQITVGPDRKIQKIELTFDEKVQKHFLDLAPSELNSDGVFIFSDVKAHLFKIEI